eukprot:349355_1
MLLKLAGYSLGAYVLYNVIQYTWGIYENYGHSFDWRSTADQVAKAIGTNLKGKYICITGCNNGIGKETAKILLKYGAHIIMACRNRPKAELARKDILHSLSSSQHHELEQRIEIRILDLSSLQSIYSFARKFVESKTKLHFLVNNAGIMALPKYVESVDGFELQFATNHLGHFYLTQLLMNTLIQTNKTSKSMGKVINLSSIGHLFPLPLHTTIDQCLRNVCGPSANAYNNFQNYGFAKAANILHAKEINRLYGNETSNVYAVSLHPGVISSGLTENMRWYEQLAAGVWYSLPGITKSIEQGAATTVYTVCLDEAEFRKYGGRFFKDSNVANFLLKESEACRDVALQKQLWTLSEKLITKKGFDLTL